MSTTRTQDPNLSMEAQNRALGQVLKAMVEETGLDLFAPRPPAPKASDLSPESQKRLAQRKAQRAAGRGRRK